MKSSSKLGEINLGSSGGMEKTRSPAGPATRPSGNSTPTKSQTYPAYPETMMASCLLREGMDESVVQSLLLKGHCKVAALVVLSGKSLSDLAAATNDNALKNRRNVEYIRTALVKLRIALPPPHPSFLAPVSTTESKYSSKPTAASQPTLSSLPTSSSLSPISTDQQVFADQQLPKIPELPQPQSATVRETSLSEHEQMLRVLREFPIAYEQYARENGLDVATLSSASNSGGGSGTSSGGSALIRPPSGEITDVGFMCGTMPNDTSLWNIITEALGLVDFFGLAPALGEQKEFSSVDQIVDEFCSSTGLPPAPAPFRPKSKVGGAKRKKKLGPLEVPVAPSLPAMHLRPPPVGDWNQKETAGQHLRDESRRLFKILSGLTRGESIPILNWEFKLTKSRVTVHQAMMPGSPWAAIKSDCIIHADKHRICKLITTDERSHEYDEQVDGFEVRLFSLLRFFFSSPPVDSTQLSLVVFSLPLSPSLSLTPSLSLSLSHSLSLALSLSHTLFFFSVCLSFSCYKPWMIKAVSAITASSQFGQRHRGILSC